MKTLIYFKGGDDCKFSEERTKKEITEISDKARESGHIGYLKGYRYYDNEKETVIVYFTYKPDEHEINRRRLNGFKGAKWHWL
jgi:hypothetical protein